MKKELLSRRDIQYFPKGNSVEFLGSIVQAYFMKQKGPQKKLFFSCEQSMRNILSTRTMGEGEWR